MKTRFVLFLLGLLALIFFPLPGCSSDGDDTSGPGDSTAPTAIEDLRVTDVSGRTVTLQWTAPGDDANRGTANQYDLRFANEPVSTSNWDHCTQAADEPAPTASGTQQTMAVNVGADGTFHFVIKCADEVPNWSGFSNEASVSIGDGLAIHQLTSSGNNLQPHLDGGFVVWVSANSVEGDEIYIANITGALPTPTMLTDDGGQKANPNNHGSERIVWEGRETASSDWEIWLYDKNAIPRYRAFTDNTVPDHYPDLAGGGDFAWLQGHTMFEAIHWWNEGMHTETTISADCCPTSSWTNERASADNGAVVWRAFERGASANHHAYFWDGQLTDLTDALESQLWHEFSLYDGKIAYATGASPSRVRYWDGESVQEVAEGYHPSLYDGCVAYESWDGHDWEIRYWDGVTIHDVTDNDYDDTMPSLHGSWVAWTGRPQGPSGLYQIFYASLAKLGVCPGP